MLKFVIVAMATLKGKQFSKIKSLSFCQDNEQFQVRVSICDPKDKDMEEEKDEKEEKGARKDSMMVPAINFARRMSMKITGGAGPFKNKLNISADCLKIKTIETNLIWSSCSLI